MLLLSLALAQTPPDSDNIGIPELDADLLHRALATQHTFVTEDAGRIRDTPVAGFQLGMGYANAPLVVSWDTGSGRESAAVLRDAFVLDLIATLEHDRLRVGLDLPIYAVATSDLGPDRTALGNAGIDARLTVLDPTEAPVGIGLIARFDLPSPDADSAVGSPRPGYELAVAGERAFGSLSLAANLGYRGLPREPLYNVVWNDLLFARLAGTYTLSEQGGVLVEAVAAVVPATSDTAPIGDSRGAPTPAEVLAGGWFTPVDGLSLRAALGTGLSKGIGTPRVRAMLDLVFTPRFAPRDRDHDGVVDRDDTCRDDPEDLDGHADSDGCPDWDNDTDGLDDEEDACPDEAEDLDGFQDDDGCPDPKIRVVVRVVDAQDVPVEGAILQVSGDGIEPTSDTDLELHPGTYMAVAFAGGFKSAQTTFEVGTDADEGVRLVLERVPPGVARVSVRASGGSIPSGYTVRVGGSGGASGDAVGFVVPVTDGVAEIAVPPGRVAVEADASGPFAAWRGALDVRSGDTTELVLPLEPPHVRLQADRLQLLDPIRFVGTTADLEPRSAAVLGQIAWILASDPSLKVQIEVRATAVQQERADAIRLALVAAGIEASRLVAVSVGEGSPRVDLKRVP
ncbi:MAG: hypothetical protein R3F61_21740 [Myxococcota bacterium]